MLSKKTVLPVISSISENEDEKKSIGTLNILGLIKNI